MKVLELTLLERCPHVEMGITQFIDRTSDWWDLPQVAELRKLLPAKADRTIIMFDESAEPLQILGDHDISLGELGSLAGDTTSVERALAPAPVRWLLIAAAVAAGREVIAKLIELTTGFTGLNL